MSLLLRYTFLAGTLFVPIYSFAQTETVTFTGSTIEKNLMSITELLNLLITLLILLATFLFLWGIVKYITAGGDEEKIKEARGYIIWGIIFLAVMVAVWGFVNILLNFIFGTGLSGNVDKPTPIPLGPQGKVGGE